MLAKGKMTPRETLFRALAGEPTDKVPVWLLFPYHPTGYYVDVRQHDGYQRAVKHAQAMGVIYLNRRNLAPSLHSVGVVSKQEEIPTQEGRILRRIFEHRNAKVFSEAGGKKLLATDDDLEAFCRFPLQEDEHVLHQEMETQLEQYRQEQREFPLNSGAMMLDLGSPINALYHAADLGVYPIWSLTHSTMIENWLDRRMQQLEYVYRFCLERELADIYFLVGSELASPPMVSRDTFQRWVAPFERRLIELVHSYGKKVIQHYHGQIRELLTDFLEMGPDGLHTIESPPVGNCTLDQAFRATQEKITLIGNIQYDDFRSSSPGDMKDIVQRTLDEVAGRRFILSPTAGPFDASPPEVLLANYIALIDAAHEY